MRGLTLCLRAHLKLASLQLENLTEFVLQLPAVELRSSAERSDLMSSNALAAQRTESAQLAALAKSIVADEPAAWSC